MFPTSNRRSLELCHRDAATDTHFDAARDAARRAGECYRRGDARPLEGSTVALEDEDGLAGWRMTAGPVALTTYADHFVQMADSSAGPAPGLFVDDLHPSFSSGS
jgi:hypothetical protein